MCKAFSSESVNHTRLLFLLCGWRFKKRWRVQQCSGFEMTKRVQRESRFICRTSIIKYQIKLVISNWAAICNGSQSCSVMSALYLKATVPIKHVRIKPSSSDSTKSSRQASHCHSYLVFTVKTGRIRKWRTRRWRSGLRVKWGEGDIVE